MKITEDHHTLKQGRFASRFVRKDVQMKARKFPKTPRACWLKDDWMPGHKKDKYTSIRRSESTHLAGVQVHQQLATGSCSGRWMSYQTAGSLGCWRERALERFSVHNRMSIALLSCTGSYSVRKVKLQQSAWKLCDYGLQFSSGDCAAKTRTISRPLTANSSNAKEHY